MSFVRSIARVYNVRSPVLVACIAGLVTTMSRPRGHQDVAGGTLVVTNMNDNTATLLDAGSLATIATLPTGRAPHEVAVSHDGRWALVSNYGARDPGNTITVIDIDARNVARTIELSDSRRPHGMAFLPGDTLVAVTAELQRAVLLVDVRTGRTVRSLPTDGRAPHIVASSRDGRRLVAGNIGDGTLAILSPLSNDSTRTVAVARQPEGVAISRDSRTAYVTLQGRNRVIAIDLERGRVMRTGITGVWSDGIGFSPRARR
jgi:YVTN family beta-propeller protein